MKHYIPHHPVVTPKKVRIVYDASANTKRSDVSLNECLLRGPVILQSLCGLLLRFRLHNIVLLADIEKAFLQVGLHTSDRDVTRFLWLKNADTADPENNVQIYRFCRVPFGVISSPFLLGATVNHHLNASGSPLAKSLSRNIYVDNVVTGAPDLKTALDIYKESKRLFQQASMNLREWSSNSKPFLATVSPKDKVEQTTIKVLGLTWNTIQDTVRLAACEVDEAYVAATRREVMKQMARSFDPLGFFVPVTLGARPFVQGLWEQRPEWDSVLSKEAEARWVSIRKELKLLSSVSIKRHLPAGTSAMVRIACFCDASIHSFATAIYLQYKEFSEWKARLIFAKSRVSPKKKLSIPRLELMAVLIGTRCMKFVESELDMNVSSKVLWTDSKCVLHWIKTEKSLSVFVENRIKEIRSHADVEFRYVKTTENPADVATKAQKTEDLKNNVLWWEGPTWLKLDAAQWPTWNFETFTTEDVQSASIELKGSKVLFEAGLIAGSSFFACSPFNMDMSRYCSLTKLLRVTAWVLRFLRKINVNLAAADIATDVSYDEALSTGELSTAKLLWERHIQFLNFRETISGLASGKDSNLRRQLGLQLDDRGVMRCHGRYANAEIPEDSRFPKLLPRKSQFTELVIQHFHWKVLHSGVGHTLSRLRQEYWIPQGRSQVRAVISRCLICRRCEGGPFRTPPMPPLPFYRTNPSPPFSYTGLDYFGPLYAKNSTKQEVKVWVCIFTCLSVRGIHLELVDDLTGDQFVMGLRRFIARRGFPIQLISDNAAQFKVANTTLKKMFSSKSGNENVASFLCNQAIAWKFIPEFAPWMGGFYERLIGLVKRGLRKGIGKLHLSIPQLTTVLAEVEAVVNSRPLVYIEDDVEIGPGLSPAMFLSLNPRSHPPVDQVDEIDDPNYHLQFNSADALRQRWIKGQRIVQSFWDIWVKDYLLSLRERQPHALKGPRVTTAVFPKIGQPVLIRDGPTPRGTWRTGVVIHLIPSSDGLVRAVKVRVPGNKVIGRPIRNLYPLECPDIPSGNPHSDVSPPPSPAKGTTLPGGGFHSASTTHHQSSEGSSPSDNGRNLVVTSPSAAGNTCPATGPPLFHRPVRKAALRAKAKIKSWAADDECVT